MSEVRETTAPRTDSAAVRRGAWLGSAVAITASLACLPASVALTLDTHSRWTSAVAGLFAPAGPMLGVLTLALFVGLVAARSRHPTAGRFFYGAVAIVGTLTHALIGIGAVRFQQERGVPMTAVDLRHGLHVSFLKSQLPVLLSPVYALALAAVIVAVVLVTWRATRILRDGGAGWRSGLAALAPLAAFAIAVLAVRTTERGKFSIGPYRRLLLSGTHPADAVRTMRIDVGKRDAGLAMLGAGRADDRCPPGTSALDAPPRDAAGARLVRALGAVSERTLGGQIEPFSLWLIVLESVGAEDVSALEAALPRGLTPFLDEGFASADAVGSDWLGSRRVYQAGVRTAQAFSAVVCGYGTAPYQLAPLRDLFGLPVRCLPDVLADAAVQQRFYYGADARYDRMSLVLGEHGLTDVVVPSEEDHPSAHWGVTDRALLEVARDDLATRALAPSFTLLFTLSTHSPFTAPPDYPEDTAARVRPALAERGFIDQPGEHLAMTAYIDAVLAERLPEIRDRELARGTRPVFVIVGDHASGIGVGAGPLHAARIPFLVWLPPPRGDETAIREELRAALAATSLSQNDVPRFVLALLSRSPELRALPAARREHSIGGQRLSPTFAVPAPLEASRIWTIDAVSRTHFLDADDTPLASFVPQIELRLDAIESDTTLHAPAAHALAWLSERANVCGGADGRE